MPPLHDAKRQFEPVIILALNFAAAFFTAEFDRVDFACECGFSMKKRQNHKPKQWNINYHKLKQTAEFWMDFVLLILILIVFSRIISQLLFD